ncbi:hypothetical protein DICPUDRAFT_96224 [Dictyostelium purpureum]|uniref:USP domain-containing protein n=1 Tax=Dictyostelium purpureum TaxID=5786 RepID=F0Z668_DICPU|nr:uncharacterized protein DICPUDRAFT_96224 [Dictyostelium purpureum]EGC40545.1 hypothetical protein DICPUDRAFT_96224 [Dictyostelium purpureum]|eukprot:XP_003282881.1 hypothetical protein DICPUDRAFT_96224 [Dictyostelium purpureum]
MTTMINFIYTTKNENINYKMCKMSIYYIILTHYAVIIIIKFKKKEMGGGRDKKKKNQKKSLLVENNKKQQSSSKGSSSNSNTSNNSNNNNNSNNQVKITINEDGDTITLKRINDSYICTNCLESFNLSTNKKGINNYSSNIKPPLECSTCHVKDIGSSAKQNGASSIGKKKNRILDDDEENENFDKVLAIGDGVKGLDNLGNTCFFNSIMQNLTHVNILRDIFLKEPGTPGSKIHTSSPLTMEMYYFFNKMYKTKHTHISPTGLFSEICKKSPRFRGFKQQDSHELLRYLLDGLISEEQNTTQRRKDPTYIDKIFGGQLISIITCFHCGYVSKTYEPFLDLSLPIPSQSDISGHSNKAKGHNFVMPRVSTPPLLRKSNIGVLNEIIKISDDNNSNIYDSLDPETLKSTDSPPTRSEKKLSKAQKKNLRKKEAKQKEKEEKEGQNKQEEGEELKDQSESAIKEEEKVNEGLPDNSNELDVPIQSLSNNSILADTIISDTHIQIPIRSNSNSIPGSPLFSNISDTNSIGGDIDISHPLIETNQSNTPDGAEKIFDSQTSRIINIDDSDDEDEKEKKRHQLYLQQQSSMSSSLYVDDSKIKNVDDDGLNEYNYIIKEKVPEPTPVTESTQNNLCDTFIDDYQNESVNTIGLYDNSNDNKNNNSNNNNIFTESPLSTVSNNIVEEKQDSIKNHQRSISDLENSFESIKLNPEDDEESGKNLGKIEEDEEEDLQKEPIDLRKDIPSDAYSANTLLSCLLQFTNPELLSGENGFICSNCKKIYKEKKAKQREQQELLRLEKERAAAAMKLESIEINKENGDIEIDSNNTETPSSLLEGKNSDDNSSLNSTPVIIPIENIENIDNIENSIQQHDSKPAQKKNKKRSTPNKKDSKKSNDDEDDIEKYRRNASKQYLLSSTPPFLTIQLKRFMQTRTGFQKNSKRIEFPIVLDLSSFTDQTKNKKEKEKEEQKEENEEKEKEEQEENVENKENEEEKEEEKEEEIENIHNQKYQLNGIVEHMGGMGGGHYVAYIYDDYNEQWFYISDSTFRPSSLSHVVSNDPYLLFYKKIGVKTSDIFNSIKRVLNEKNQSLKKINKDKEEKENNSNNNNNNNSNNDTNIDNSNNSNNTENNSDTIIDSNNENNNKNDNDSNNTIINNGENINDQDNNTISDNNNDSIDKN